MPVARANGRRPDLGSAGRPFVPAGFRCTAVPCAGRTSGHALLPSRRVSPERPCHGPCNCARAELVGESTAHLVLAPGQGPRHSACVTRRSTRRCTRHGESAGRAARGMRRLTSGGRAPWPASLGRRSPRRPSPPWTPHTRHPPVAPRFALRSDKESPGGRGALLGADLSGPSGHRPLGPPGRGDRRRPRAPVDGCAVRRLARPGGPALGARAATRATARARGRRLCELSRPSAAFRFLVAIWAPAPPCSSPRHGRCTLGSSAGPRQRARGAAPSRPGRPRHRACRCASRDLTLQRRRGGSGSYAAFLPPLRSAAASFFSCSPCLNRTRGLERHANQSS